MNPNLILNTSITLSLKRYVLFRGIALAALGCVLLLLGGIYIPADKMGSWGFALFISAGLLVTAGMLPYRKLSKLEMNPSLLKITSHQNLEYYIKGRKSLIIPLSSIRKTGFFETHRYYGICLWLTAPIPQKNAAFDIVKYQALSRKGYKCDLYLPYFTKRSYDELTNQLG